MTWERTRVAGYGALVTLMLQLAGHAGRHAQSDGVPARARSFVRPSASSSSSHRHAARAGPAADGGDARFHFHALRDAVVRQMRGLPRHARAPFCSARGRACAYAPVYAACVVAPASRTRRRKLPGARWRDLLGCVSEIFSERVGQIFSNAAARSWSAIFFFFFSNAGRASAEIPNRSARASRTRARVRG
jgi:hypothetical protein